MMVYEMNKEDGLSMFKLMRENEAVKRAMFPWPQSLLLRFMPKSFSKPKDMKKLLASYRVIFLGFSSVWLGQKPASYFHF
jgi:hypothetical protein